MQKNKTKNGCTVLSENGGVVVRAINSTAMVAKMERLLVTSATASAALGRLLTAAALMGLMQKGEQDTLTLKVNGGGEAGTLTAIADTAGHVRGSVENPLADAPLNPETGKLDVGGIVGSDGFLTVIRDFGRGEPYSGKVRLVSGEIAEDITSYFAVSEQTPTVCALGVLVNPDLTIRAAGGFLLQLLPGADEHEISLLERNIRDLKPVSALIDDGQSAQEIAFSLLEGFSPQLLAEYSVSYRCNCSRDKMRRVLLTLGREELVSLAAEAPETEIVCSYCNKKYVFSSDELEALS